MCNDARYYKCNLHVNGEISNSRFDYIEMSKCCGAGAMDLANPLLACTRVGFWLPAQCLETGKLFIIPGLLTSNLGNCSSSYRYYCHILWQYRFWSFQAGCTKLERFLIARLARSDPRNSFSACWPFAFSLCHLLKFWSISSCFDFKSRHVFKRILSIHIILILNKFRHV